MVQTGGWGEAMWLHGCRLGREPNGPKEHIWRDLQDPINSSFLVQQEAEIRGTQFRRGRVYGSKLACMRGYMDEEDSGRVVRVALGAYCDLL